MGRVRDIFNGCRCIYLWCMSLQQLLKRGRERRGERDGRRDVTSSILVLSNGYCTKRVIGRASADIIRRPVAGRVARVRANMVNGG